MRIKNILICFTGILILTFAVSDAFAAENTEIFNNILNRTNSTTTEIGINADYEISTDGKNECIDWLKSLNLYNEKIIDESSSNNNSYSNLLNTATDVEDKGEKIPSAKDSGTLENWLSINNNKEYCREFEKNNIHGYIESRENGNGAEVSIFIRELTPKESLNDIEIKIRKAMGKKASNINIYKYLKAKTPISNIKVVQNKITNYLKDIDADNISTVNINEGYSTVAYTKNFGAISDDGKSEDFNYAVLKESGQNYIILGTPLIDISY
ncbi:YwmB family TATA-box binding protein [Clostridium akagii]|uniref:YwmB family TATA-box binding protein n=1 Tax=Clostridium akagii TaxID=91623 RepID=UPI000478DBA1|nr:YwmB family TATA-box binding protein [Clostridium akagii]